MKALKCQRCGKIIDCSDRKEDNKGNIILVNVCTIVNNNKKEIVCKKCFNKYNK